MAAKATKKELITVKSNLTNSAGQPNRRVALFERHKDHPKRSPGDEVGEVMVVGDREVLVAETSAVRRALSEERIVKVEPKAKSGKSSVPEPVDETDEEDDDTEPVSNPPR